MLMPLGLISSSRNDCQGTSMRSAAIDVPLTRAAAGFRNRRSERSNPRRGRRRRVLSLRRRDQRNLAHLIESLIQHQLDATAMERAERRTMADGDNGRAPEAILQQAIQRRLGGLVQ